MSSTFTSGNRRKKIVTYGRTTTNFNLEDEAPSPERPRKQVESLRGGRKRPAVTLGPSGTSNGHPTSLLRSPISRDVFDVPSDDELNSLSPPALPKKPMVKKQASPVDDFDVLSSGEEALPQRRRIGKTPQPLRKPEATRRQVPINRTTRKPQQTKNIPSDDPLASIKQREKTPQLSGRPGSTAKGQRQRPKKSAAEFEAGLQENAPAPPASAAGHKKNVKRASALPFAKSAFKPPPESDIFDVPPSEDDAPVPTLAKARSSTKGKTRRPTATRIPAPQLSPSAGSDESNSSRKRKREESSQGSTITKGLDTSHNHEEKSGATRSTKHPNEHTGFPDHEANGFLRPAKVLEILAKESTINKPKRTRIRTASKPAKPPMIKGQSSPATLNGMLAVRSLAKRPSSVKLPETVEIEEETMYEMEDPATPVPTLPKPTIVGSVTPRQKQLFGNLLGDSSDTTTPSLPSIRKLQLTDRKPGPLVAGLARASSDIPQTLFSRKTRLIDTLRHAASSSEDEEDSESDEETVDDTVQNPTKCALASEGTFTELASEVDSYDNMEIDHEIPVHSQASQNSLHGNLSTRVTYAKQRSYLEESNLEDGLLLSMDLDVPLGLSGHGFNKRQEVVSDEEEDPASQVRGIHELRRQGQNQKFLMETQTAIDEISGRAGLANSGRRSVMLDFCTRMADEEFLGQLFESALGHQFLEAIGSYDDIIFDFAASVSIAFILHYGPGSTVLDEILGSGIMTSIIKLLECSADISRIAKERKTNLSRIGRESVDNFRTLVQESSIWSFEKPDKVTPQIASLKSLELLILALRKYGSTQPIINEGTVCKILDLTAGPCERLRAGKETSQDAMTLSLAFSIMEAVAISNEKQATWSGNVVQRLVALMPVFFSASGSSPIRLAIRLCILLTNNKPRACEVFAGAAFVKPLVAFICHRFTELGNELSEEDALGVREDLILSLGAMINIAEFSDQSRVNVVDGGNELLDALVNTFLEGSKRAAQATRAEELQAIIPIGYLTVLLGNLCLNGDLCSKMRSRLPGRDINLLVDKVTEFVSYHERVDRMTGQFEGEEGREASQNYTMRLMRVVERLQKIKS